MDLHFSLCMLKCGMRERDHLWFQFFCCCVLLHEDISYNSFKTKLIYILFSCLLSDHPNGSNIEALKLMEKSLLIKVLDFFLLG